MLAKVRIFANSNFSVRNFSPKNTTDIQIVKLKKLKLKPNLNVEIDLMDIRLLKTSILIRLPI